MLKDVAGKRLRPVYKTLEGRRFYGSISTPPSTVPRNFFEYPRRILTVSQETDLALGTIISSANGRKYLICDNGEDEQLSFFDRTYRLIQLDQFLTWERYSTVTDPVTGFQKSPKLNLLGNLWCVLEPAGEESDKLNAPKPVYRMFTGAEVLVEDVIGMKYQVQRVEKQLGVTIATVA